LVERRPEEASVGGSNPPETTNVQYRQGVGQVSKTSTGGFNSYIACNKNIKKMKMKTMKMKTIKRKPKQIGW